MPNISGHVVVITGAARGIGAELARVLTGRGARVALLGLEPAELAAVSATLPGSRAYEVDVTDSAALSDVAAGVVADFGRVDAVVANAGIGEGGPLLYSDPDVYDRVIEVNLLGSVRTVRAFLPAVVQSRGYVLQVASVAALVPAPMMSAYCASKSGVEAFAHALRGEVRHHGVDVGVAYLTWTDTDMVRNADQKAGLRELRARLPWVLGRTYALGPAVVRLADGLVARRAHVYGQGWLRLLPAFRGAFPALTALGTPGLPQIEQQVRTERVAAVASGSAAARR
ncbi:MAG TPA: SDR family oxidoreductase [Mycobacteriales bacterium]|jgi:NAD(P)-dependent dehydrogenase (short-subunit alcohol dehydrogenase family)|nr:SDR family oxidoreductase [Mycobacteriales bacterium]